MEHNSLLFLCIILFFFVSMTGIHLTMLMNATRHSKLFGWICLGASTVFLYGSLHTAWEIALIFKPELETRFQILNTLFFV